MKYGFKFMNETLLKSFEAEDSVNCAKSCDALILCVAWNYNGTTCSLLDSYTKLSQTDGIVSGRHHTCLGRI